MPEQARSVLRETTPEVVADVRALITAADHAALASIEPETGWPMATRVGLVTAPDGAPVVIASALTPHFAALVAEPRCGLLVAEAARGGDPLANPRLMLACRAGRVAPESGERNELRARYLARHPKSAIYVDLPDFSFFRLEIVRARHNAGFGRAYEIAGALLMEGPDG